MTRNYVQRRPAVEQTTYVVMRSESCGIVMSVGLVSTEQGNHVKAHQKSALSINNYGWRLDLHKHTYMHKSEKKVVSLTSSAAKYYYIYMTG